MPLAICGGLVLRDPAVQPTRADILVDADRIVSVGPDLEIGPEVDVLDARNRLVIPGLVNAHTHAHNNLARGAIDGLPLEIWYLYLGARVANRTPRDVYVGATLGAIEMAKTGTTCACEMAMLLPTPTDETLDAVAQAYVDVGLRASIATHISDAPFFQGQSDLEQIMPPALRSELAARPPYPSREVAATLERAVRRWHGAENGRINFGVGPSVPSKCSTAFLEACGRIAHDHAAPIQTHLEETKSGALGARQLYGQSSTARMAELGLLGPRTLLAHGIWLEPSDMDLLAESGSTVSHNPVSNLKLGSGIQPLGDLLERGCSVAIGTDGSASADSQNLFPSLKLAAILHRVVDPNYDRWPGPADVPPGHPGRGAGGLLRRPDRRHRPGPQGRPGPAGPGVDVLLPAQRPRQPARAERAGRVGAHGPGRRPGDRRRRPDDYPRRAGAARRGRRDRRARRGRDRRALCRGAAARAARPPSAVRGGRRGLAGQLLRLGEVPPPRRVRAMKFGLRVPACRPPREVADLIVRAEAGGFDYAWIPDSQLLGRTSGSPSGSWPTARRGSCSGPTSATR